MPSWKFWKASEYKPVKEDINEDDIDEDIEENKVECTRDAHGRRIFHAKSAPPQELNFTIPLNHNVGEPVCVTGPHGPLMVPVPDGARPGRPCSVKLGPSAMYKVTVPEDHWPGDEVKFKGNAGEQLQAVVPKGYEPGDTFEVTPLALMVQVPEGAAVGDLLVFTSPEGVTLSSIVPDGMGAGQYFAAALS
mmetsp:Transcript_55516/g.154699  ORF Transcript_55516/g.154699 Transcript_55516/m.154699 type:complete len:191 (+) Transcript_55516:102-674(+)